MKASYLGVAISCLLAVSACGGGGGASNGANSAPQPSGIITFGTNGIAITSSPTTPINVSVSGGIGGGPFTAIEGNYSGSFAIVGSGPCLVPTNGSAGSGFTTSIPSGGFFSFQPGLLCIAYHTETVTISDNAGHSILEYFYII